MKVSFRLPGLVVSVLLVAGCATMDDLNGVRGELNYRIQSVNEKVASVESLYPPLKEETQRIREDIENTKNEFPPMRSALAELRAELTDIKQKQQQLRGLIDSAQEESRKDRSSSASLAAKIVKREEAEKALREKIDSLIFKINFIENFIGVNKKEEQTAHAPAAAADNQTPASPSVSGDAAAGQPARMDKGALYSAAFNLFKEARYANAREAFESFLKQYPNTEFSDNALFWLGECYYFEKRYEKAIVEYDKLIKGFPTSSKVSHALLKQGLSFLKLGDKESARLLLQQVTKDYPNTSQARIARAKLLEIK